MKSKWLLFLLTFWLGPSVLVDFVAAPAIFRNVSSLQEAGSLGMVIFKALNTLELALAIPSLVIAIILAKKNIFKKYWLGLFILLIVWVSIFRFHITPSIISINNERYELNESSSEYKALSNQHDFYHKLYVKMEGAKVIMLIVGIVLVFRIKEEQTV